MNTNHIAIAAATLMVSIAVCSVAAAQGTDPPARAKNPVRSVAATKSPSIVTPSTGSLSVSAEPNASLLVEPLNHPEPGRLEATVPADQRVVTFNGLKPGKYRVAGTLAGHQPAETQVTILANRSQSATLVFEPILFAVTINTNIRSGQLKYGFAGEPLSRLGSIQSGQVQIRLPPGKYAFEVTPEDVGYEVLRETFSVTKDEVFDIELRGVMSTETFGPSWTRSELQGWEVPLNWGPGSKGTLRVKGPGVALPREPRFRNYQNFLLESEVTMSNDVAISFALRARDQHNYYLVQLTGNKADEPQVLRLMLVRNGIEQRLQAVPISRSAAAVLESGRSVTVSIRMVGFNISVDIVDTSSGDLYRLGVLSDPNHNFGIGAVGIAARKDQENVIERFVVCTGRCLEQ